MPSDLSVSPRNDRDKKFERWSRLFGGRWAIFEEIAEERVRIARGSSACDIASALKNRRERDEWLPTLRCRDFFACDRYIACIQIFYWWLVNTDSLWRRLLYIFKYISIFKARPETFTRGVLAKSASYLQRISANERVNITRDFKIPRRESIWISALYFSSPHHNFIQFS